MLADTDDVAVTVAVAVLCGASFVMR